MDHCQSCEIVKLEFSCIVGAWMGCRIGDLRKDVSSVRNETHISTNETRKKWGAYIYSPAKYKNKCIYISHARIDNPFKPMLTLKISISSSVCLFYALVDVLVAKCQVKHEVGTHSAGSSSFSSSASSTASGTPAKKTLWMLIKGWIEWAIQRVCAERSRCDVRQR